MIKNFDLTGWEQFSDRRNSQSYVSNDKKWMVKFYTDLSEKNYADLEREKNNTMKALEIGVKTPKVDDIIELSDGRLGLIYEYIEGKSSISRAMSKDTKNAENYIKRFAKMSKEMHNCKCDTSKFVSMEDKIRKQITMTNFLNEEQKKKAFKLLDTVEKKNNFLHGDFQPSNFIVADDREFVIDLDNIGYGNPIYDVACFYYFTHYMPYFVTKNIFHIPYELIPKMWYDFVKYYYGVEDDEKIIDISEDMKKYALVSFYRAFDVIKPGPEIKQAMDLYFDDALKDY